MTILWTTTDMTESTSALEKMTVKKLINIHDKAREEEFRKRAEDWRNGPVVYQVLVDRFAPSRNLESKKHLYKEPQKLRTWDETPKRGEYLKEAGVWSHEVDFWGGDIDSLSEKLEYLKSLKIDALYLNPIFLSLTNHKYDAWDYSQVDPVYGTRKDLGKLAENLHRQGIRLILDGVFNHMGKQSPFFQEAIADEKSPWRKFFTFSNKSPRGYISWLDVENLPELNLENPAVRDYLYAKPDSIVQSYLRKEKIDGWRLDVAYDLGFKYLEDLTEFAHEANPESVIIGEIWNYPEEWHPAVDGVMNMHGRRTILSMLEGKISAPICGKMWETAIEDAGMDHILKTWLLLDNHDTARLPNILSEPWQQKMARILQFTLPGAVCLYYGSELGMTGGIDPEQRAPMRWDLVNSENEILKLHKKLLSVRKNEPALRYGDFRLLHTEKLLAFMRKTISVRDTILVLANPTDKKVEEMIQLRESKFQDSSVLFDLFSDAKFNVHTGFIHAEVPPQTIMVLKVDTADHPMGYNRYSRIY